MGQHYYKTLAPTVLNKRINIHVEYDSLLINPDIQILTNYVVTCFDFIFIPSIFIFIYPEKI